MRETNGKKIYALANADAVFTTCEYLKRYITSFLSEDGFVLIDGNGTYLYTDARYLESAEKLLKGTEVQVVKTDRFSKPVEILKKYKKIARVKPRDFCV